MSKIAGVDGNSITTKFCDQQKQVFGDTYTFKDKGGMANMAQALSKGMVLVMSLWDDHYSNMLWLDSTYPTDKDASVPGIGRGDCDITSGVSEASFNSHCLLTWFRYPRTLSPRVRLLPSPTATLRSDLLTPPSVKWGLLLPSRPSKYRELEVKGVRQAMRARSTLYIHSIFCPRIQFKDPVPMVHPCRVTFFILSILSSSVFSAAWSDVPRRGGRCSQRNSAETCPRFQLGVVY